MKDLLAWWPARPPIDRTERLRSSVGALLGILVTGLLGLWVLGPGSAAGWLIAPMGASAVLLFAVPASPLAQPWSIVGGNLVAGFVGISCAKLIDAPALAAALAVSLAIGVMLTLRCLHPPSGAVALMTVIGGPQVHAAGYGFMLTPLALNTMAILGTAIVYNRALGRRYPHRPQPIEAHPHQTADVDPIARMGFTPADLRAALTAHNQLLDVSVEDLDALFRKTEQQAYHRHFGQIVCRQVMSRDVLSVEFATELADAWQMMQRHAVQALPVIDKWRRVIGIVTHGDFLRHADLQDYRSAGQRLRAFLQRTAHTHSDKHEVVGQIMSASVRTAQDTTPIVDLVPLMADLGMHHVPVVDAERRLVGIVTQTDLVAALYETSLGRLSAAASGAAPAAAQTATA